MEKHPERNVVKTLEELEELAAAMQKINQLTQSIMDISLWKAMLNSWKPTRRMW